MLKNQSYGTADFKCVRGGEREKKKLRVGSKIVRAGEVKGDEEQDQRSLVSGLSPPE